MRSKLLVRAAAVVVLCLMGLAPSLGAQGAGVEATIRTLESQRLAAMLRADVVTLGKVFSDDLTYAHASGVLDTKASMLSNLSTGALKYKEFTESDVRVRVYGDVAVLTGKAFSRAMRGTQEISHPLLFTAVYALKKTGGWQLVAWQTTEVPKV